MLTTNEIRALCDAADIELRTWQVTGHRCAATLYSKHYTARITKNIYGKTEDEAILAAWEAYVNSQRD